LTLKRLEDMMCSCKSLSGYFRFPCQCYSSIALY